MKETEGGCPVILVKKYPLGLSLHQGLKALTPYAAVTVRGALLKDTRNLVYIGPGVKKKTISVLAPPAALTSAFLDWFDTNPRLRLILNSVKTKFSNIVWNFY